MVFPTVFFIFSSTLLLLCFHLLLLLLAIILKTNPWIWVWYSPAYKLPGGKWPRWRSPSMRRRRFVNPRATGNSVGLTRRTAQAVRRCDSLVPKLPQVP